MLRGVLLVLPDADAETASLMGDALMEGLVALPEVANPGICGSPHPDGGRQLEVIYSLRADVTAA